MDTFLVKQSKLSGELTIPPSKSHTLRAILFGSLAKGISTIHNYLNSTDTLAMIDACRHFGAIINVFPERIEIVGVNGHVHMTEDVINAGNSGIVLRFCAAIGALASNPVVLTGDHSIRHQRPMKPLINGLTQLGVKVKTMRGDGYAPVIIEGPINSGKAIINGEDSQPVSALLIASAFATGPVEIIVQNAGEKPWVGLTLDWFDRLGISYENHAFERFNLVGRSTYAGFEYTVPGDFSSAAFPIAAALITRSELLLNNVDMNDSQGDKELISVFREMGAVIEIDEKKKTLFVKKCEKLSGIIVDINNFVDAITILAVVACFADSRTQILNAVVAKDKECNRIHCIATELAKMGANIQETYDGLIIHKSLMHGTSLQSYNDHRMAMSLAVAGMGASGITSVTPIDCIAKTFPSFASDFIALGANLEVKN